MTRLGSGSLLDVVCNAQAWLRENLSAFSVADKYGQSAASMYVLETFIDLDLREFPLEESGVDAREEVASLRNIPAPKGLSTVASFVHKLLWNAITVDSGKPCANCGRQGGLKILVDASDPGEVYLACDYCVWIESIDGMDAAAAVARVRPPTIKELEQVRWKLPAGCY
ncbi:MAG: hypothetical protein ABI134_25975 [Byssovorax sp.]